MPVRAQHEQRPKGGGGDVVRSAPAETQKGLQTRSQGQVGRCSACSCRTGSLFFEYLGAAGAS